jgi:hypothetical protein
MLREEGVGLALDRVEDLAAALAAADVAALRRRVADVRARLTVKAQIGRIAELYRDVAADQRWATAKPRYGRQALAMSPAGAALARRAASP